MGVAWHRFTAWFNIFYKRESDGSTALGAMKPLTCVRPGNRARAIQWVATELGYGTELVRSWGAAGRHRRGLSAALEN